MKAKIDIAVLGGRDRHSVTNFAGVEIEPEDRLPAGAFAQIKREQSHAAADVEDRRGRGTQEFVSGLVNSIAAQLPADIVTQPALGKLGRHPRTRTFVIRRVSSQGFHLRRFIALPD